MNVADSLVDIWFVYNDIKKVDKEVKRLNKDAEDSNKLKPLISTTTKQSIGNLIGILGCIEDLTRLDLV